MSPEEHKAALLPQLRAELAQFQDLPIRIELDLVSLLALIGPLQLALRHPNLAASDTAVLVRRFIGQIQSALPPECAAVREIIQMGFHPQFDE